MTGVQTCALPIWVLLGAALGALALCGAGLAQPKKDPGEIRGLKLGQIAAEMEVDGFGEFALFHFNKAGFQNVIQLRATYPPVLSILDVVARKGVWMQLHIEPVEPNGSSREVEAFGALALFFRLHPDLQIILSHTAMTNPTNARRILAAYPKVMMSIKLTPRNDDWAHLEPVVNRRGELYEDWATLMEDMPDRFMVGSDVKFASEKHGSGDKYPEIIALFRDALGSLSPDAAKSIASANARRLLFR